MPVLTLTLAKFGFLALLYVFVAWTARVVLKELRESAEPPGAGPDTALGKPPDLLIVEPGEQRDRRIPLAHGMTIGRADDCTVRLDDNWLSAYHVRVFARGDDYFIEDTGSTNGTFVNRKQISTPTRIRRGDTVQIGRTVMEVVR